MARELFRIPGLDLPIFGYGTMVLLGFLAGYLLLGPSGRKAGLPRDRLQELPVWLVLSGLAGGRLFYVIQFYEEEFSGGRWLDVLKIWQGGLVFYGGIIGGTVAFWIYCARKGLPRLPVLDAIAPSVAIGLGFGRVGCFLNGCCWGKVCSGEFLAATRFPPGSPPSFAHGTGEEHSLPVHPTQLYAALNAFLLALVLLALLRRRPPPGTVIGTLALLYGVSRFLLEFLRGDHAVIAGEWTVSQGISAGTALLGLTLIGYGWSRDRRRSRGPEADRG